MNNLKTILIAGSVLGSLYCTNSVLADENIAQKDSVRVEEPKLINKEFEYNPFAEIPFYESFFDNARSWTEYEYNPLTDFNGEVRVTELEKKLSKDFDFFIKSKSYEVNIGIRFNF